MKPSITIYVGNSILELYDDVRLGLTVSIADIEDPFAAKSSFTETIKVPKTKTNLYIFGHDNQLLSPEVWNHEQHRARILVDGIETISGKVYLESIDDNYISFQIVGNELEWAVSVKDKALNEVDSEPISKFTRYALASQSERKNAFFALIEHGYWWQEIGENKVRRNWATFADLIPFVSARAVLRSMMQGYTLDTSQAGPLLDHLYISGAWKKSEKSSVLAEDNEFEVISTGRNVRKLYLEGEEVQAVGAVVTADNIDEAVYVEGFDAIEDDPNGRIEIEEVASDVTIEDEPITHAYPRFNISEQANVSFDIRAQYTSTFALVNGEPIFTDTVHFGGVPVARLALQDSLDFAEINNGEPINADEWKVAKYPAELPRLNVHDGLIDPVSEDNLVNFYLEIDHPEAYKALYIFFIDLPGKPDAGDTEYYYPYYQLVTTDIRSKMYFKGATTFDKLNDVFWWGHTQQWPSAGTRAMLALQANNERGDMCFIEGNGKAYRRLILEKNPIGSTESSVQARWLDARGSTGVQDPNSPYYKILDFDEISVKLYKFTEAEAINFDVKLQTTALAVSPNEPYSLALGFACSQAEKLVGAREDGSDAQLLVTVKEDSSIKPQFNDAKPYGSDVSMNDIGGDVQCVDVLHSIQHLLNLRFYTNPDTKVVHVATLDNFYRDDVVDWRERLDYDAGVKIDTLGNDIGRKIVLSYQDSSQPVEFYNKRHPLSLYSYEEPLLNHTEPSDYVLQNPTLNPPVFTEVKSVFADQADTAKFVTIVAKNSKSEQFLNDIDYEDVQTTLVQLSSDGDTIDVACYGVLDGYTQPKVIESADEALGETINFADVGEVKGLHKHYDKQIAAWNYGRRITCRCRVLPREIDSLRKPGTSIVDFRSRFLLNINGDDVLCRLESINGYEPNNATCECVFIYSPNL